MEINHVIGWDQKECVCRIWNIDKNMGEENSDKYLIKNGKEIDLFCKNDLLKQYEMQEDFDISDGAVVTINENGVIRINWECKDVEADLFITNKCNSNCIMCPLSEHTRRKNGDNTEWIDQFIEALPCDIPYINITGGEPTLNEHLPRLLAKMRMKFQYTEFQMLTNGRSFAIKKIFDDVMENAPNGVRYAIPIHASMPDIHDGITQAKGSFFQTDVGIKRLLSKKQKVEIRIVLSRKNIEYVLTTAKYIGENYKGVFCVNIVAMEMMGNAAKNRNEVWIDYDVAFEKCQQAIDELIAHGIDVQLYNFPLCFVDKRYWGIVARSISGYKIRYYEECDKCKVKEICGGMFSSTKQLMHPRVVPQE